MSDFPNKLKKLRINNGLTQAQLATSLHVSQNAIYNWENGKREPNLEMVQKIAQMLNIPLYVLIDNKYELDDITTDAYKNKARFMGDTEMLKPPLFTVPASPRTTADLNTNSDSINQEQIDDERFDSIMRKIDRGARLSPQEIQFKTAYLEKSVRKVGDRFAEFYSMLNDEGKKMADEQISRAIQQIMLLTKIPEYQKKAPDTT